MSAISLTNVIFLGIAGLLAIGFYGLLVVRNLIKLIIVMQVLVKAVIIGLVAAGNLSGQINVGQSMALTVIVADTVVAVIGLALAVQVKRQRGTLDVDALSTLQH